MIFPVMKQAIGGSKGGDEKKEPELEFVRDNPQWLTDSEDMAADFVNTPAMEHLKHDRLGEIPKTYIQVSTLKLVTFIGYGVYSRGTACVESRVDLPLLLAQLSAEFTVPFYR